MKTIPYKEMTDIVTSAWPILKKPGLVWYFDSRFPVLPRSTYEEYMSKVWQKYLGDCDDASLFLHADIKRAFFKDHPELDALAIGEVSGSMCNGWPSTHNWNIGICEDKSILMIEPQTKETWVAHKTDDQPFWLRF